MDKKKRRRSKGDRRAKARYSRYKRGGRKGTRGRKLKAESMDSRYRRTVIHDIGRELFSWQGGKQGLAIALEQAQRKLGSTLSFSYVTPLEGRLYQVDFHDGSTIIFQESTLGAGRPYRFQVKQAESFASERYIKKKPNCRCGAELQWDDVKKAWYCIKCPFNTYPNKRETESFAVEYYENYDWDGNLVGTAKVRPISMDTLTEWLRKCGSSNVVKAEAANPVYVVIDSQTSDVTFAMNLQAAGEAWKDMEGGKYIGDFARIYKLPLEYRYPYLAAESFATEGICGNCGWPYKLHPRAKGFGPLSRICECKDAESYAAEGCPDCYNAQTCGYCGGHFYKRGRRQFEDCLNVCDCGGAEGDFEAEENAESFGAEMENFIENYWDGEIDNQGQIIIYFNDETNRYPNKWRLHMKFWDGERDNDGNYVIYTGYTHNDKGNLIRMTYCENCGTPTYGTSCQNCKGAASFHTARFAESFNTEVFPRCPSCGRDNPYHEPKGNEKVVCYWCGTKENYQDWFDIGEPTRPKVTEIMELEKLHGREIMGNESTQHYAYKSKEGKPMCGCGGKFESMKEFEDWAESRGWTCYRCGLSICEEGEVSCDGREIGCDINVCPFCSIRDDAWYSQEGGNWCSPGCKYHTEVQRLPAGEQTYDKEREQEIEEEDRQWYRTYWDGIGWEAESFDTEEFQAKSLDEMTKEEKEEYWRKRAIQDATGRCADCDKYILNEMYFDLYDAPRSGARVGAQPSQGYAEIDWETERCLCACEQCDILPNKLGECDCEFCCVCEDYVPNVGYFPLAGHVLENSPRPEEEFTICEECLGDMMNLSSRISRLDAETFEAPRGLLCPNCRGDMRRPGCTHHGVQPLMTYRTEEIKLGTTSTPLRPTRVWIEQMGREQENKRYLP